MRDFIEPIEFYEDWKNLGLDDELLAHLQMTLMANPEAGDLIQGAGGARKIRFSGKQIGKRGGIRVIYVHLKDRHAIALFLAYGKKEKDDLSAADKRVIKELIIDIKKVIPLRGNKHGKRE